MKFSSFTANSERWEDKRREKEISSSSRFREFRNTRKQRREETVETRNVSPRSCVKEDFGRVSEI